MCVYMKYTYFISSRVLHFQSAPLDQVNKISDETS